MQRGRTRDDRRRHRTGGDRCRRRIVGAAAAVEVGHSRRGRVDEHPVLDAQHAGGAVGDALVVRDRHEGEALGLQLLEEGEDVGARARVEVAGRLVGEDHGGPGDERAGDRDALALAAGELRGVVVRAVGEADAGERLLRALDALLALHPGVDERRGDVLERGLAGHEVEALEDEADGAVAQQREPVVVEGVGVDAGEEILPGGGPVEQAEDVQQRRLARARGPDDGDVLAELDAEVDPAQRRDLAVAHRVDAREAASLDERRLGGGDRGISHRDASHPGNCCRRDRCGRRTRRCHPWSSWPRSGSRRRSRRSARPADR